MTIEAVGSHNADPEIPLALIVGAARSGTTLLRLLLDAHPEVGAPAEAGIPSLIEHVGRVWWTISPGPAAGDVLSADALGHVRQAALAPMNYYCGAQSKRIYCDKSLDSVHHLERTRSVFPGVRCILQFRHVMDTVASGLEASPWGFNAFGYAPFVLSSIDNFVAALVSYWQSHVAKALEWEKHHPDQCHRVRYEDLVTAPETTLAGIFEFLGVDADFTVVSRAFSGGTNGPGDYKIAFTERIHADSLGRGHQVPVQLIPAPLLAATNEQLAALGYEPLTAAWNAEPSTQTDARAANEAAERLRSVLGTDETRLPHGQDRLSVGIVADDDPGLRWVIEHGKIRRGDGEVDCVVTGTASDLVAMIEGEVNVGVLLRSGRVRHLTGEANVPPGEVEETMKDVMRILRSLHSRPDGNATSSLGRYRAGHSLDDPIPASNRGPHSGRRWTQG